MEYEIEVFLMQKLKVNNGKMPALLYFKLDANLEPDIFNLVRLKIHEPAAASVDWRVCIRGDQLVQGMESDRIEG